MLSHLDTHIIQQIGDKMIVFYEHDAVYLVRYWTINNQLTHVITSQKFAALKSRSLDDRLVKLLSCT